MKTPEMVKEVDESSLDVSEHSSPLNVDLPTVRE